MAAATEARAALASSDPTEPREKVGEGFEEALLLTAQRKAWQALNEVAETLRPGMSEKDAGLLLREKLKNLGYEKQWHPAQIRFGVNTGKAYAEPGEKGVVLKEDDIFFLDIGPVFDGYEADVGAPFVIGNDPEHRRIVDDCKAIFEIVKAEWKRTGRSGQDLYDFATNEAEKRGWTLSLKGAAGHRVSEFPHSVHHRGKLNSFDGEPSPNRWILEIHLRHKTKPIGAFFEDIL